jgi:aryl-alcohol dehydrogenase-like predicted oxidoreductase
MTLPRKPLGRTGFEATTLGYGAMELRNTGSDPSFTEADADKVLNAVLDAGINFIDTSIDYGRSEELIGKFISNRRDE